MPKKAGKVKQAIRTTIAVAALLLSGRASAEVLHDGKVYQVTADKIIKDQQLVCAYGDWTFQTLPNGSTVLMRGKYCVGQESKRGPQ